MISYENVNNYSYNFRGEEYKMENEKIINELSRIYKIFGDPTRIKILQIKLKKEVCVQDISNRINMTHSAVSHQLSILKDARLVKSNKLGKLVYYSLDDEHVKKILDVGIEHVKERN